MSGVGRFVVEGVRPACWSVKTSEEFEAASLSWIGFWEVNKGQHPR